MKTFTLVSLFVLLAYASPHSSSCRCRPHQSCWPSPNEWSALNSSVGGNLVSVRPLASVCHGKGADSEACHTVRTLWSDSIYKAAQPGASQWENWDAWPERHQSCYIETVSETPCGQGRISLYSTIATSASDIQATVRFAKKHNLRLAIKNSGHCFLGRSSAPESVQILTNRMKDIKIIDDFIPKGARRGYSAGPAVTIGAGVSLQEMYAAVTAKGRIVVGGASHTVGAAGGYIQGGGHSFLGTWKGMASDNALEFTVVTAEGDLVTANEYQNQDLFWALRGGGGGTFGVVVDVTLRTFDDVPLVFGNLNISTALGNDNFWEAMTQFHAHIPTLNDAGGAGYYYMFPNFPISPTFNVSALTLFIMFPNQTDHTEVDRLFAPMVSKLNAVAGVTTQYASATLPTIEMLLSNILLTGNTDSTGGTVLVGSRLFSRDLLISRDGPKRLISALRSLEFGPGSGATGHIVAGGAVAKNRRTVDSALNPAWREAAVHLTIGRGWSPTASLAEQHAIRDNLTNVEVPILRSVEGPNRMGAYLNEANAYEEGFQKSFWGHNYRRLYSIKQKWDPSGLFITRSGVGSEDWDAEGLCRVGHRKWKTGVDDLISDQEP